MILIDLTLPTPEANLALDEILLDEAEEGGPEVLRFWESTTYCVVLGSSGRLPREVRADACRRDGVPILRRHSGGGTVLLGPGCLHFSLVLSLETRIDLQGIHQSFRSILGAVCRVLAVPELVREGISDLSIADRKVSGNAQRRRRGALLHQGTMLYDFDVARVNRYLPHPPKEPSYRQRRSHSDFLTNLPLSSGVIKSRIGHAWNAKPKRYDPPQRLAELVNDKYANPEWTSRF